MRGHYLIAFNSFFGNSVASTHTHIFNLKVIFHLIEASIAYLD